jgi:hypothetical protein
MTSQRLGLQEPSLFERLVAAAGETSDREALAQVRAAAPRGGNQQARLLQRRVMRKLQPLGSCLAERHMVSNPRVTNPHKQLQVFRRC